MQPASHVARICKEGQTSFLRCYYVTVDPETRATENGICLAQQMCHIMILVHNGSSTKDQIGLQCFCHFLHNIGFPLKETTIK